MLVRPLILSFIFIVVGVGKRVYTADNKTMACIYARNGAKTPSDDERMRCYCCQYTNIVSIVLSLQFYIGQALLYAYVRECRTHAHRTQQHRVTI